ncbi:MAG: ATP-binding cassette domain-containing protein [Clostridiaceae bacterium]
MNIKVIKAKMVFGDKCVLDVGDILFEAGNVYFIMGSNGSGKTTLIEGITGIRDLSEENIVFIENEKDQVKLEKSERIKHISHMQQNPYLFNISSYENLVLGSKFRKKEDKNLDSRIKDFTISLKIDDLMDKKPGTLSGGEKEKISLIRTMLADTRIIILDEPTAAMDQESTLVAEEMIKELAGNGKCVIIVSHDFIQAERLADYILFLDKGKCIEFGTKDKVLKDPDSELLKKILNITNRKDHGDQNVQSWNNNSQ